MTDQATTAPARKRGRPVGSTKPPIERKSRSIHERITEAQHEKYIKLGAGNWLRRMIDKSRAP